MRSSRPSSAEIRRPGSPTTWSGSVDTDADAPAVLDRFGTGRAAISELTDEFDLARSSSLSHLEEQRDVWERRLDRLDAHHHELTLQTTKDT
jgi:hypothetical protein